MQHPVYKTLIFHPAEMMKKDLFSGIVKTTLQFKSLRIWRVARGGESISTQYYKPHILINYISSRNICKYLLQQEGLYSCLVTAPKSVKNPNNQCWSTGKKSKCHIYRNSAEITACAPFYRFCSHPLESQEQSCPPQQWKLSSAPPQGDIRLKDHRICGNFTQEPGKADPDNSTQLRTI